MRKLMKKAKEGFTLVELMIVVAIVGILAVLAVYGVRKYIANAKTTEARNLARPDRQGRSDRLRNGVHERLGHDRRQQHRASSVTFAAAPLPRFLGLGQHQGAEVPVDEGRLVQLDGSDQRSGGRPAGGRASNSKWDAPQYFMYGYTGTTGTTGTFTSNANGDLNGDGNLSTFSITGAINSSGLLNTAPSIAETSPEE